MPFTADEIIRDAELAKALRQPFEALWKDCMFYTNPPEYVTTPGSKLPGDLYDSTGIYAANTAGAGIAGYLTNSSEQWFNYELTESSLMEDSEVKQYLKDCTDIVNGILDNSNFYQKIEQLDRKLVQVGAPVLYCEEDPNSVVRFFTIGHLDCAFMEDDTERVDTMYRWREYTALQAWKKFGKKAGPTCLKLMEGKKYTEKVLYIHAVVPRYERDASKDDNKNMPWASVWVSVPDIKIIEEKGYPEFPYFVPRWQKIDGTPYAYCPAAHALADMKTLNDMDGTILQAGKVAVKPPLVIPHDGYVLPITQKAGGLNYKLSGPNGDKIETLQNQGNLPLGLELTEQRRRRVEQAFFVDLFRQFQNDPNMTATEVNVRNNQTMLLLGPSIGNVMTDCLSPALFRVYMIAGRAGMLPPPPQSIANKKFTVRYTSVLARAQKMAQLNGITNTIAIATQIIGVNPESSDVVDFDEAIREIAEINGTNPKITRDAKTVDKRRADRAAAAEKQAQMEMMMNMANMAKTGAEASATYKKAQEPAGAGR